MDMVVSTCWLNQPATAAVTTTTKIRQAWIRVPQEHGKNSQKTGLPEIQASNAIGLLLAKPLRGWNNLVRHWIARREKWKQECKRIQLTFSFQLDHVEWCWMYVNKGRAKTHHAQYIERLHHTHAHAPVFRICFVESWIFCGGHFGWSSRILGGNEFCKYLAYICDVKRVKHSLYPRAWVQTLQPVQQIVYVHQKLLVTCDPTNNPWSTTAVIGHSFNWQPKN